MKEKHSPRNCVRGECVLNLLRRWDQMDEESSSRLLKRCVSWTVKMLETRDVRRDSKLKKDIFSPRVVHLHSSLFIWRFQKISLVLDNVENDWNATKHSRQSPLTNERENEMSIGLPMSKIMARQSLLLFHLAQWEDFLNVSFQRRTIETKIIYFDWQINEDSSPPSEKCFFLREIPSKVNILLFPSSSFLIGLFIVQGFVSSIEVCSMSEIVVCDVRWISLWPRIEFIIIVFSDHLSINDIANPLLNSILLLIVVQCWICEETFGQRDHFTGQVTWHQPRRRKSRRSMEHSIRMNLSFFIRSMNCGSDEQKERWTSLSSTNWRVDQQSLDNWTTIRETERENVKGVEESRDTKSSIVTNRCVWPKIRSRWCQMEIFSANLSCFRTFQSSTSHRQWTMINPIYPTDAPLFSEREREKHFSRGKQSVPRKKREKG